LVAFFILKGVETSELNPPVSEISINSPNLIKENYV